MTKQEYLLVCANEEAIEIATAIDKSLRFGLNNLVPNETYDNKTHIVKEFNDLVAILEMLVDQGVLLTGFNDREHIAAKKAKVLGTMKID